MLARKIITYKLAESFLDAKFQAQSLFKPIEKTF